MRRKAYIGVGANLGDPLGQVERALAELARWGPLRASSLYRTEPLGDPNQPWYINAVAELETEDSPGHLLRRLKRLERRMGRGAGGTRWAPRVLDLDLLLLGDQSLERPELKLPHPAFHLRRFVLEPLTELAPEVRDPRSGKSARELLLALDDPLRVEKLERTDNQDPAHDRGFEGGPRGPLEVQQT